MQINVTYDPSTAAGAPAGFFSAVQYVVNLFDTTFTNNASINIEFGYGDFPADGSTVSPLGESQQNRAVFGDYSQVRNILVSEGAPGAGTLPSSSPLAGQLVIGSAEQKALGLIGSSSTLDGWVGIASNAALQSIGGSWSFSPTATPSSSQFYIVGTIEHEISEVMGRVSLLNQRGEFGLPDLYRYSAPGVRQTGTGDPAYFSLDNGVTNLDNWNDPSLALGDLADWAPNVSTKANFKYAGADAFLNNSAPGQINGLTASDLKLMAALGWNSTPTAALNRFSFFTSSQSVNVGVTPDGSNPPPPVAGVFNLELVTSPAGTSYPAPPGYQGVAILPGGTGQAVQLLSGDFTVVDMSFGSSITLGSGTQTAVGGKGDTITGGSGKGVISALAGNMSVVGGSGTLVIWAAAGDTIKGSTAGGSSTIVGALGTTITGGAGSDLVNAVSGGASVTGGTGATTIWGGAGDTIAGGPGTSLIDGTFGSQRISGGIGQSIILGGAGDTITGTGGSGGSTIVGAANSTIAGGGGIDLINALTGTQSVTGGGGSTTVWGGAGDTITGGAGALLVDGTLGKQRISGGPGSSSILGGAADTITGSSGSGTSIIIGAKGLTITGGTGNDLINGILGSQSITGGSGSTTIWGAAGDTIVGGSGKLFVDATLGGQQVVGGPGTSAILGGAGDTITGSTGKGASVIIGAQGSTITGGAGFDLVNGIAGAQRITGGSGTTTVWGGAGDTISGGSGNMNVAIDHSVISGAVRVGDSGVKGSTTVSGFSQPAGDRIFFPNETTAAISSIVTTAQSSGGNTLITLPDGGTMTLLGITKIDSTFFG